jgi:hypothetical protein
MIDGDGGGVGSDVIMMMMILRTSRRVYINVKT